MHESDIFRIFVRFLIMRTIRYSILFLFLSLFLHTAGATKRALVIGIGAYPSETGWASISGANDVPVVRQMLIDNGFEARNIQTLIDAQATYNGIKLAFHHLIATSQTGDDVYIQFCGHGQQITDVSGDEADAYGLDEAWVPYDAYLAYQKGVYEGQHHLIDDELNVYLSQLRRHIGPDGHILVIADACHTAGSTRGDDDEEEWEELIEQYPYLQTEVHRGGDDFIIPQGESGAVHATREPVAEDWLLISACDSHQANYEYNGLGSLTYVMTTLPKPLAEYTGQELYYAVVNRMRSIRPRQNPKIDGPADRKSKPILSD